jgi:hypothetical protein
MSQKADSVPIKPIGIQTQPTMFSASISRFDTAQLKNHLRSLGAGTYNLLLPETRAILYVLQPGEQILGIVYGRYKQDNGRLVGRGALIATDGRVLLLDKKPMFIKRDEIVYEAISGITYGRVGIIGTIVLHTKIGDIKLRTFNKKCSLPFVEAVENNIYARRPWQKNA